MARKGQGPSGYTSKELGIDDKEHSKKAERGKGQEAEIAQKSLVDPMHRLQVSPMPAETEDSSGHDRSREGSETGHEPQEMNERGGKKQKKKKGKKKTKGQNPRATDSRLENDGSPERDTDTERKPEFQNF